MISVKKGCRIFLFTVLSWMLLGGGNIHAITVQAITVNQLVRKADMIFAGKVREINYRLSDRRGKEDVILPHTFVTFDIERVYKGSSTEGEVVTLRFQGGPGKKGSFLEVSDTPRFQVGDTEILFVRGGYTRVLPVVGGSRGRFRVIDGGVFSDDGREIWLGSDGNLAYGKPDPKVLEHIRPVPGLPARKSVSPDSEDKNLKGRPEVHFPVLSETFPMSRLTSESFAGLIKELVKKLHTPEELKNLTPVVSADITEAFYVPPLKPVGLTEPVAKDPQKMDSDEYKRYRETGNPVLKDK